MISDFLPSDHDVANELSSVVLVVDDDPSIRSALDNLFSSVGLKVKTFECATRLLATDLPDVATCMVLDVRMPGLGGLELQAKLANANIHVPVIIMTSHGDIPMTVKAMKAGAVDFLSKPFRDQDMLDAVSAALDRDRERRGIEKSKVELRTLFESLTPSEQKVMSLVSSGMMNKSVAAEIGLKEITVKVNRGKVMRKMHAKSLADLVRMAETLGIASRR
jgi:FixJ family two-component response regulator